MLMIKKLIRRHWLVAMIFIIGMSGLIISLHIGKVGSVTTFSPAQVVAISAIVVDQGVRVEWLESQAGTYPIGGYIIERERDGSVVLIGRVEKTTHDYIDTEGQVGDTYRIIAEDDQLPAAQSVASQPIVANRARPGSAVLAATSYRTPDLLLAGDDAVTTLRDAIAQAFAAFDDALSQKNAQAAKDQLAALYAYQQQAMSLQAGLKVYEKSLFAQVCMDNLNIFEANLHTLTDQDLMSGMLVLAACNALQDGAQ